MSCTLVGKPIRMILLYSSHITRYEETQKEVHKDAASSLRGKNTFRTSQRAKREKRPGKNRGAYGLGLVAVSYCWFGKRSWVKPVVLTSRKSGVRGGKYNGSRNSTSKL